MPRSSTSCRFKNSRDAFWKNPQKRTEKQAILFEAMQPTNLQSVKAWTSREDLKAIFQSFEIRQAKERFPSWLDQVKARGIREIMDETKIFQRHLDGMLHALVFKPSNARSEQIKTVARGFRQCENFRSAVFFSVVGSTAIHPHCDRATKIMVSADWTERTASA